MSKFFFEMNNLARHYLIEEKMFSEFYREHKNFVFRVALNITHCANLARDARQDVFLRLWMNRHRLNLIGDVDSYLFICTRNECINLLQKRERIRYGVIDEEPDSSQLLHKIEAQMQYETVLKKVVTKFPSRRKQVYRLTVEGGMRTLEIARALNLSPSAIKTQKSLATDAILAFLEKVA